MEWKKKLPIGIEFFKDMRTRGYYYVDKTGFIRELLLISGEGVEKALIPELIYTDLGSRLLKI